MINDPNTKRRLAAIEERTRQTERQVAAIGNRVPNQIAPQDLWLGITRTAAGDSPGDPSTYPAVNSNVFDVAFDDPYYVATVGRRVPTSSLRSTRVNACSLIGWIGPNERVVLVRKRGQSTDTDSGEWWIIATLARPILRARLTSRLDPGYSATAKLQTWDWTSNDFVDTDPAFTITITDLSLQAAPGLTGWNFGLIGELLQVTWQTDYHTDGNPSYVGGAFEPIGSTGLLRRGKVYGSDIAPGAAGNVRLYVGDNPAPGPIDLSANLKWNHNSIAAKENDEVWVEWLRQDRLWHIRRDTAGSSIKALTQKYTITYPFTESTYTHWKVLERSNGVGVIPSPYIYLWNSLSHTIIDKYTIQLNEAGKYLVQFDFAFKRWNNPADPYAIPEQNNGHEASVTFWAGAGTYNNAVESGILKVTHQWQQANVKVLDNGFSPAYYIYGWTVERGRRHGSAQFIVDLNANIRVGLMFSLSGNGPDPYASFPFYDSGHIAASEFSATLTLQKL